MKTLSVAVAVAVVLTFIYIQESSAVPVAEHVEVEQPASVLDPAPEESQGSWMMPYHNKQGKGIKCRFCCHCCIPGHCGWCCRF